MKFQIEAMTCGGCARSVAKAVQTIDPQARVTADVPGRSVEVESARPAGEIAAALEAAGFPARQPWSEPNAAETRP